MSTLTGVVYDNARHLFYMSTSDGDLFTFNPALETLVKSLHIGTPLAGLDISPTSDFILVTDSTAVAFAGDRPEPDHHVSVHRIDLATWKSTDLKYDVIYEERGSAHVAITNQHTALLTTDITGSGWIPFREFNPQAMTFDSKRVFDLISVRQTSYLATSESHRYVLVVEESVSNGPIHVFDAAQDKIIASKEENAFLFGPGDISDRGLVVDFSQNSVKVLDLKLDLVKDLSAVAHDGNIIGAHFAQEGKQLLLWDAASDTLVGYDTQTWSQVFTVPVSLNVEPNGFSGAGGLHWGSITVGGDSGTVILQSEKGFEVVKLPATAGGGSGSSLIHGTGGADQLSGGGGDTIYGGAGDDVITDPSGSNYLRGEEGNDSISGGAGFDDINGNAGADTAHGNDGDDWVVGGKDGDLLFGDNGFDIVYGNLGDDTVSGGDGADWVRGGQGADSVSGGAGDDLIWGDRGDDTVSGGSGADTFHSFSGAGLDRIIDFSLAEGDRVQLDRGSVYTIKQVGSDAVIDLGGGDQVVLVGIQAATLTAASVFVG